MDQDACVRAGIDYQQGAARFMGKTELYEKFLRAFLADPDFPALEKAMEARDVQAAFQAGHSLKGVSGNLSINGLYNKLLPFVDALRGDGDIDKALELFGGVREEYERAVACIREQGE